MANEGHLKVLKLGVSAWNTWRREHTAVTPDLSHADLSGADLSDANLSNANLTSANLHRANLWGADFSGSDLRSSSLRRTNLSYAKLHDANLQGASFNAATLFLTACWGANLSNTNLIHAVLSGTTLPGADLHNARIAFTHFADLDLREVKGLEAMSFRGPSEVSISTIYRSEGRIPDAFLRGCGVPESFIVQIPALVAAMQAIQFHSCFISYSTKDDEFAKRLHARMRQEGLRVWFAPEDMKGGDYFSDQIDRAIQLHDRLLLVLSENSIASNWVIREIKRARRAEEREGRKKLFPISLTRYEVLRGWECLDHDSGLDLAEEVRKFHIPDFSSWKNHDDFEREFSRLYESLKDEA